MKLLRTQYKKMHDLESQKIINKTLPGILHRSKPRNEKRHTWTKNVKMGIAEESK